MAQLAELVVENSWGTSGSNKMTEFVNRPFLNDFQISTCSHLNFAFFSTYGRSLKLVSTLRDLYRFVEMISSPSFNLCHNHTGVSNPVICAFAASTACNCNCRCLQELGVAKVGSRLNKRCLHLLEGGKCYLFCSTEKCSSRTRHQLYWTEIAGSSFKPTNGWQIWEDCELSASVNLLRHTNRLFFC